MKRAFLLFSLCLFFIGLTFGQNFKFANLAAPGIIDVPVDGVDGTGEKFVYFNVTNTGDAPVR